MTAAVLLSFFLVELVLRYGVAIHGSYLERQGAFAYSSLYGSHKLENAIKKSWGIPDLHLHIKQPLVPQIYEIGEATFVRESNSEGLREKELEISKQPGEIRVVALGDSFTEGLGAEFESSWPRHLERMLQRRVGQRTVTAINGGVAGSDPIFAQVLLRRRLLRLEPDVVVVAINTSDIFDVVKRGGNQRFRPDNTLRYRSGPWWEPLYATSYISRHVIRDVLGFNWWLMSGRQAREERELALTEIAACLGELEDLATFHGFDLMVVVHPMHHELNGKSEEFEALLEAADSVSSLHVFDLRQFFTRHTEIAEDPWSFYWPGDLHHNAEGYRLFAQGVASELKVAEWSADE